MTNCGNTNSKSSRELPDSSLGAAFPRTTIEPGRRLLGLAFSSVLRLLSASWRVRVCGNETLGELATAKQRCILAFWHRHYITLFKLLRDRPVVVVTNQSSRGQVIANICHRNGMRTLQVAEERRLATLESIESVTLGGFALGIAVDGPLGPAGKVKHVVPHLARTLQCPIVPISVTAHSKSVLKKRWDRLEIPWFFSRVSFVIGEPIEVPLSHDRRKLREAAHRVQSAINAGEQMVASV